MLHSPMPANDFLTDLVAHQKQHIQHHDYQALIAEAERQPACRGFANALAKQQYGFIAEMKKASPSAGLIREDYDPASLAHTYQQHGATCLSVLTNASFQGEPNHLQQARSAVDLPVLRKDFVVDAYQIYETRCLGADAMLLIVACLTEQQLVEFQQLGWQLGMDVLVEVHNKAELQLALKSEARLIGVNNRNLHNFEVRLETSEELLPLIHQHPTTSPIIAVAESGIKDTADVQRLARSSAQAFLVGETLMRSSDPGQALAELRRGLV